MPRQRKLDILMAGAAIAGLYFLLRSAGQTPDGLSYALAARTGLDIYHPHHLLHGPVTRFLYLMTGSRDAILAGVLHNLGWLVVLAYGAWRLALGLGVSHTTALVLAVGLLASRGVLFYSTHVETYLPALACLAMLAAVWQRRAAAPVVAVWLAMAVLYHQTNVLVVLPLLIASERRRQDLLTVVLPAGAAVLAVYIVAWRLAAPDVDLLAWMLTYVQADVPAWGSATHLSLGGWRSAALNQMRMVLPVPWLWANAAAVGLTVLLLGLIRHHWRRRDRQRERRLSIVMLLVYLPFFVWWIPSDPDFFLATLLPLWLLGGLWLADRGLLVDWRLPAAPVLLLLVGNIWFVARPMSGDPGPLHRRAWQLDQAADDSTALVVGYGLEQELLYFTDRTAVHEGDTLAGRIARGGVPEWDEAGSGEVLIERDYLRLLLERAAPLDQQLLQTLLAHEALAGSSRDFRWLPDAGLLIGTERREAGPWPVLWAELEATAPAPAQSAP